MAIAPVRYQINKKHTKKSIYSMYKVSLDTIKIKNCQVVTLTGEAIRCYTLPKGDVGATTAKRQLLYVSRHINPVAGCSFKSYTQVSVSLWTIYMYKRYSEASTKPCQSQVKRNFKIVKHVFSRFQLPIDKCKIRAKMVLPMFSDTLTDCVRS